MSFLWDETLSSLPLASVPAVVLDTETTGLDRDNARILQFGAVKLSAGSIDDTDQFDHLVRADIPIPAASTEIHGITDADVADARSFPEVLDQFCAWAGTGLFIGYSIGFDLTILQAEHERTGRVWTAPRCLDVRHLTQVVAGANAPDSLEATATWLNVEVTGRHTALGDALTTARVFLALIPKLHENGIQTVAAAEQASLGLLAQQEMESRAGWHEVVARSDSAPRAVSAYARIDSYAYRHRVTDVMSSPPAIIDADEPISAVITRMVTEGFGSIFVVDSASAQPTGIITERDILRAVNKDPANALNSRAATIASGPLLSIGADEHLYRAMSRMTSHNIRHLAVTGFDGNVVGAISARDLLHQRAEDAVRLGENVDAADSPEALGRVWAELTTVVRNLVDEEVDVRDIAGVISRELRAVTARAGELAERDMEAEGRGRAPAAYALMVLGSGGRGESLLAMDQDNALIYADTDDAAAQGWFLALGAKIADTLNAVGVKYCDGGIMASNPAWCMPVNQWRDTVGSWIGGASPQDILNVDIFFDSVPVLGDKTLAENLWRDGANAAAKSRQFIQLLARNASDFQIPIGAFGRFRRTDGRLDLKAGGIMPIFSAARVVSLKFNIDARSTPARLTAAKGQLENAATLIDGLIEAHKIFLTLIVQQQLRDIEQGSPLSNKVDPSLLSSRQIDSLKWAFDQVRGIPDLLGTPIGIW